MSIKRGSMTKFPMDDDPTTCNDGRSNAGARNKRHLVNDSGGAQGSFVDTDNAQSNEGGGGGYKKPRAGDGYGGNYTKPKAGGY